MRRCFNRVDGVRDVFVDGWLEDLKDIVWLVWYCMVPIIYTAKFPEVMFMFVLFTIGYQQIPTLT